MSVKARLIPPVTIVGKSLREAADALVRDAAAQPVCEAAVFPVQEIEEPVGHPLPPVLRSAPDDIIETVHLPVNPQIAPV